MCARSCLADRAVRQLSTARYSAGVIDTEIRIAATFSKEDLTGQRMAGVLLPPSLSPSPTDAR